MDCHSRQQPGERALAQRPRHLPRHRHPAGARRRAALEGRHRRSGRRRALLPLPALRPHLHPHRGRSRRSSFPSTTGRFSPARCSCRRQFSRRTVRALPGQGAGPSLQRHHRPPALHADPDHPAPGSRRPGRGAGRARDRRCTAWRASWPRPATCSSPATRCSAPARPRPPPPPKTRPSSSSPFSPCAEAASRLHGLRS